jgi:hypothetical protein
MEQNYDILLNENFAELDKITKMYKLVKRDTSKMSKEHMNTILKNFLEKILEHQQRLFNIMEIQNILTNNEIKIIKNDFDKIIQIKQSKQKISNVNIIKCFRYLRITDDLSNFINKRITTF